MEKRTTIKDVAAKAHVSPQAVSRALGDADDISKETKARIKEIARELGYVKNTSASALRSGGTKMIAVVYDNPVNLYFSFMIAYLHTALKSRGYSMLMMVEPLRRFSGELYLSVLSRNVDGILSFLEPTEEAGALIDAYGVPMVLVGRRSGVKNVESICTDDVTGGRIAANYLTGKGAKKIVLLSEDLDLTCARDRFEGFRAALSEAGLFDEKRCLFLGGETVEDRWTAFLRTGIGFDGIFCFSDFLAYETKRFFQERGIETPPIVGYDDVAEKIPVPMPVPSVGSDKRKIAETSVSLLIEKIERKPKNGLGRVETNGAYGDFGGDSEETIVFPVRLVVR